jgi:uncharacterized membrane protein
MDGIIVLLILFPVVFLFLLISLLSRSGEQKRLLQDLYDKVSELNGEIKKLRKQQQEVITPEPRPVIPPVPVYKKEEVKPIPEVKVPEPVPVPEPTPLEEKAPLPVLPPVTITSLPELLKPKASATENKPSYRPEFISEKEERDYEKFIGENIANKIGIAVLVLGISFFIKYAIDKDWIHESGRVIIGLISGGILIGFAHYFRNQYRSFSSVLVGGGLSVFYFSIAFAFHQYHLISQSTTFISMVIISGLGVFLSLYYNRQELAILAAIGGFITPFLVSTGQDNYSALFTYLCILNAGLMVLAWFKRWPAINSIALVFTTLIYGGWLTRRLTISTEPLPRTEALLFATLFYLLFMAMHIINTIRLKNKFRAFDFMLLLSTSALYYLAGMLILDQWNHGDYKGLFTGLLGLFNGILAIIFYRDKNTDRNFVSLLIGLTLSFLSMVAPVQFDGNDITLFWAAETVTLYWLFMRSRIVLLKLTSVLIAVLMLLSLLGNWSVVYLNNSSLPVLINSGFVTGLVVATALLLYYFLQRKEKETVFYIGIPAGSIRTTTLILGICISYLTGILEINFQFSSRNPDTPAAAIYLQLFSYCFIMLLLFLFRKDKAAPLLRLSLTLFAFFIYIWGLSATRTFSLYLMENGKGIYFLAHWIAVLLLLWLLFQLIRFFFKKENEKWSDYRLIFTWLTTSGIIVLLSVEMYQVIFWSNYLDAADWAWWENLYYKAGLSILWGLCSFAMMWLGMKKDFKTLRIISLTLFTITIVKLFLYDIVNIPPGGKIAAFILLGILLLAVSFMYQRLKKILLDNNRSD